MRKSKVRDSKYGKEGLRRLIKKYQEVFDGLSRHRSGDKPT